MAGNVPGYEEPQCFVVHGERRELALQTVNAFVEHLEKIAEKATHLELQRFTPLLNQMEDTWGLTCPSSPVSSASEQERGESTGFDDDEEESENDSEETEEDLAFIDDDDELEEDLSFYRRPGVGRTGAFARRPP